MFMCMGRGIYVCAFMWMMKDNLGFILQMLFTGSLTCLKLTNSLCWMDRDCLGLKCTAPHTAFLYMGSGNQTHAILLVRLALYSLSYLQSPSSIVFLCSIIPQNPLYPLPITQIITDENLWKGSLLSNFLKFFFFYFVVWKN